MSEPQLLGENKDYYDRLAMYVTQAWTVDVLAAEATMAEIKGDLLEAQANGVSAERYFGKTPQLTAKAIVANLPKRRWRDYLAIVVLFWVLPSFGLAWLPLTHGANHVALGTVTALGGLLLVLELASQWWGRHRAFVQVKPFERKLTDNVSVIAWLMMALFLRDSFPEVGVVPVSDLAVAVVGIVLTLAGLAIAVWLDSVDLWLWRVLEAAFLAWLALPVAPRLGLAVDSFWLLLGTWLGFTLLIWGLGKLVPDRFQAQG